MQVPVSSGRSDSRPEAWITTHSEGANVVGQRPNRNLGGWSDSSDSCGKIPFAAASSSRLRSVTQERSPPPAHRHLFARGRDHQ
jgi:hypothetical protein